MKHVFHKILTFIMAFIVIASTMSFTVDMHYCGDTLVDVAVFHEAESCGMDIKTSSTNTCTLSKKSCCNNKQLIVSGQQELQLSIDDISFNHQVFIASFIKTYIALFEISEEKKTLSENYPPPTVVKTIYKLDETYLI